MLTTNNSKSMTLSTQTIAVLLSLNSSLSMRTKGVPSIMIYFRTMMEVNRMRRKIIMIKIMI